MQRGCFRALCGGALGAATLSRRTPYNGSTNGTSALWRRSRCPQNWQVIPIFMRSTSLRCCRRESEFLTVIPGCARIPANTTLASIVVLVNGNLHICKRPWASGQGSVTEGDDQQSGKIQEKRLFSSCGQPRVSQPLPADSVDERVQPLKRVALYVTFVQAERELINVTGKVLRADLVIDAIHAALQERPNAFDTVRTGRAASKGTSRMVHRLVAKEQPVEGCRTRWNHQSRVANQSLHCHESGRGWPSSCAQ